MVETEDMVVLTRQEFDDMNRLIGSASLDSTILMTHEEFDKLNAFISNGDLVDFIKSITLGVPNNDYTQMLYGGRDEEELIQAWFHPERVTVISDGLN